MGLSQAEIEKIKHIHDVSLAKDYLFSTIKSTQILETALSYAIKAHEGQTRKSGEPYIVHPILVASLVYAITYDEAMAISALLHDVVEDTDASVEDISELFGEDIAHLVAGLTKIDTIRDSELTSSTSDEKLIVSALSFRKLLLASIADVRVLVVKLCDRLHNMLTLDALPSHKQIRISEETVVVYAPIAHRLGISFLKNRLEDLSFSYLFKDEEKKISQYLDENYHKIELKLNDFKDSIQNILVKNGFCEDDFEILSRVKHRYSIYLKMQRKGVGIDEVLDLLAVRILTKDPVKCYNILGLIHLNFKPLASRFKDYIAVAKDNGYQTIHTSVFYKTSIFEVQIRTYDMHKTAELGVAAHWKYKSGGNSIKLDWLNNLGYQNESVEDFYELIKNDLYSEDISVFSPKGQAYTLPRGAVALDFAYAVHTDIGNKAKASLVNKIKSSLLSELHNGDIVKILTGDKLFTRCSWIDAVKTSKAKSNMRSNCSSRIKDINIKSSISILATALDISHQKVLEWLDIQKCEQKAKIPCDIEHYKVVIAKYIQEMAKKSKLPLFLAKHKYKLKEFKFASLEVYSVTNISDIVFDYCCHPKSGDEIVAFLEDSKAHIHHKMCSTAGRYLEEKKPMVFVKWQDNRSYTYNMIVSLHNEKGALAKFLTFLVKLNIDINSIELGKENSDYVKYCELTFETKEIDIDVIRKKLEKQIKIIQLVSSNDAYK